MHSLLSLLTVLSACRLIAAMPGANIAQIKALVAANVGDPSLEFTDVIIDTKSKSIAFQVLDLKSSAGRASCSGSFNETQTAKACSIPTYSFLFSPDLPYNWTLALYHTIVKDKTTRVRTGSETFPCSVAGLNGQLAYQAPGCLQVGSNCKRIMYAHLNDAPSGSKGDKDQ
ncbi:MAG: hypothetical protein M1814_002688 [Vezdaea aestivalis]|nr:MAG: hypothetical protein M1814_002688 [Vezdaea aestivalis]